LGKSKAFAIRIYKLCKYLDETKREYILSKQLLRSGTSIGSNLAEAQYAITKKEFLQKATISLKECAETEYWLELLKETAIITPDEYTSINTDCHELLKLLISITKSTKQALKRRSDFPSKQNHLPSNNQNPSQ
jgi:four helix bundle protein